MTSMTFTYIEPLLPIFLIISSAGLVRLLRCKGSLMPILGVLGLVFLSWPPVDWLLSRPLEASYPIHPFPSVSAQAIVVFGSSMSPPIYERPYALPDLETYQRCKFAAWLHRNWQPLPVLACGGPAAKARLACSITMRYLLQREGVSESMIWTEERSRSTHENAAFGAEILRKHGIGTVALVVEAQSMLRAAASLRKQGILVVPAPCEFREIESPLEELIPSWKAVSRNERTLHEAVGLAWYWLRGWI
jgi:uncharacterized SAM-binding protein YcdF (DUF218 family)